MACLPKQNCFFFHIVYGYKFDTCLPTLDLLWQFFCILSVFFFSTYYKGYEHSEGGGRGWGTEEEYVNHKEHVDVKFLVTRE